MKTSTKLLTLLATLATAPAFATWVTIEGGASSETATFFADDFSSTTELVLVPTSGADASYFNANGKTIQYLKATDAANVYVSGGFTIAAPAAGNSLIFDGSENVDSRLTFSNGTYNFGSADAPVSNFGFRINSFVGSSTDPVPQKAVVFDSDTVVNVNAEKATFEGPYYGVQASLPAYIIKGTFNVNNTNTGEYGNIHLYWNYAKFDGTTRGARPGMRVDGGTLNFNDIQIDNYCSLAAINGGEINSTGTVTLYGNNADTPAPSFTVEEGSTANLNNLVHRVGILNGKTVQSGVKTTIDGTLNIDGKFSFDFQDRDKITGTDSVLQVRGKGVANINEVEIDHTGRISASNGGVINVNTFILEGPKTSVLGIYGGTVNVKNFYINGGYIEMSSSAVLNITDDSYISGSFSQNFQTCEINVTGGTLSYGIKDTLNLSNVNSKFNIKNGATLLAESSEFVVGGNGTLTVEKGGTLKALSHKTTTKLNVSGSLISTQTGTSNFYALTIGSAGTVTFNEGGTLTVNDFGRISLSGKLIVNSGKNSITTNQVVFWDKNNYLEVNGEDAFVLSNGKNELFLNVATYAVATIKVSKTNRFGQLNLQQGSQLNLILDFAGAEDYVYFDSSNFPDVARIYVDNFENNRIKFGSISRIENSDTLKLYDSAGNVIDFQWVATDGGYWLNFAAVPEPAEWAMILGGFALAFAIYRRRK